MATAPDTPADAAAVSALLRAVLSLGQTERAGVLLSRYGPQLEAAERLAIAGSIAEAEGRWQVAAQAYAAAAVMRPGSRGSLDARGAAAFERAGLPDSARAAWRRAREALPAIGGWLALREAWHTPEPVVAESLFAIAPREAWTLALEVRAHHRLLDGDPVAAEALLNAAGLSGQAAELALARADTAVALALAERAVLSSDSQVARRGIVLLQEHIPPQTAAQALAGARAVARLGSTRQAVAWGRRAVTLGDTAPATVLQVGQWLEASGRRREALEFYALAGERGIVAHARARLRLGDRGAIDVLQRYAQDHPQAADAPWAFYAAADALRSDSLLRDLARRWPHEPAASRARMRLADGHIGRRDSARAEPYLLEEIAAGGSETERARYLVARVRLGRRDVQGAAEQFRLLATADSTGYYGLLARQAADLPEPVFDPTPPRAIDSTAADLLAQLSLLDDAGLTREADVLVADIVSRTWPDADAALDAAEGLVRLGRANQAIRLGYTASRSLGPHHPRVLRAVFPWPDRGLISAEAEAFGLDPYLVAGLIRQESWFLPTARSRAGAVGYMQLMPATAREVARRLGVVWSDGLLTVGDANVHVGSAHLAALLRTYQGDTVRALAAYNAGGRPVARWSRLPGSVDPASFVEQISYPETRGYVRSVVRNRALYRALYPTPAVP